MHYVKTYAALWLYPTVLIWIMVMSNCKEKDLGAKLVSQDTLKVEGKVPGSGLQSVLYTPPFEKLVTVAAYFCFIDSIVHQYDTAMDHLLTEHILVQANPWIIDSLAATDYYTMRSRGILVKDQRTLTIFKKGDSLLIPDREQIAQIQRKLDSTWIDVNVPEFKLRIYEGNVLKYTFPVRVGQNRIRYLALVGRAVSLQTDLGSGHIYRIEREPYFINPVDGKHFTQTKRDDGIVTEMPLIPWLETEINGVRNGDMIHPTTNPTTLSKPWSNGCIGTSEADAWRIYYHAPVGTRVNIRYDLKVLGEGGDSIRLEDIYRRY